MFTGSGQLQNGHEPLQVLVKLQVLAVCETQPYKMHQRPQALDKLQVPEVRVKHCATAREKVHMSMQRWQEMPDTPPSFVTLRTQRAPKKKPPTNSIVRHEVIACKFAVCMDDVHHCIVRSNDPVDAKEDNSGINKELHSNPTSLLNWLP